MLHVAGLDRVDLATLQFTADLQTRLDRKYIVTPEVANAVVAQLAGDLSVLEIDGSTDFAYESIYFDTPQFDSFLGSAQGRRRRFKVRTRSYLDSGACVLELKSTGGRGHTVKVRHPYRSLDRAELTDDGRLFLAGHGLAAGLINRLEPTLLTSYRRTTLLGNGFRGTMDVGLECRNPIGNAVRLDQRVLIESKSPGGATRLDHSLWQRGIRPVNVSKYGTGLAALHPELPSNKWHRTLNRHFGAG